MKKIFFLLFLVTSLLFAEIPRNSKVLYFKSEELSTLVQKIEEISEEYTIIDWKLESNKYVTNNFIVWKEYIVVMFVEEKKGK